MSELKCTECGERNPRGAKVCRRCGAMLPKKKTNRKNTAAEQEEPRRSISDKGPLFWVLCVLIALPFFSVGVYKAYFWFDSWRAARPYRDGASYAMVSEITMDYGAPGHAVTIFGKDGDVIAIDELKESYLVLGGLVRIEVPDSFWFDRNPEEVAGAKIELTPTVYHEDGTVGELPIISYEVETPYAPVTLVNPSTQNPTVYASVYDIKMNVVPGSTVRINGEDVSGEVDRDGSLTVTVNVLPTGDNRLSLYASTDHYKDTRMDIVLYRPEMEIPLELSSNTQYSSTRSLLSITGVVDPTADIVVDTAYEKGSIQVNRETGKFEFRAKFSTVGYNTVRFRAVKEGYADSTIAFQVYYLPSLAEYSRNAWVMDYKQLCLLYEQWNGRVFQCIGSIYDVFTVGDDQYVVMNVGNAEEEKLVVLLNMSGIASFDNELQYRAYADVSGDYYYDAKDYPLLTARYLDVYVPKDKK